MSLSLSPAVYGYVYNPFPANTHTHNTEYNTTSNSHPNNVPASIRDIYMLLSLRRVFVSICATPKRFAASAHLHLAIAITDDEDRNNRTGQTATRKGIAI